MARATTMRTNERRERSGRGGCGGEVMPHPPSAWPWRLLDPDLLLGLLGGVGLGLALPGGCQSGCGGVRPDQGVIALFDPAGVRALVLHPALPVLEETLILELAQAATGGVAADPVPRLGPVERQVEVVQEAQRHEQHGLGRKTELPVMLVQPVGVREVEPGVALGDRALVLPAGAVLTQQRDGCPPAGPPAFDELAVLQALHDLRTSPPASGEPWPVAEGVP
jgi:hypothetical protein